MQVLKIILLPFSVLYGLVLYLRNKCFDWRLITQYQSKIHTVGVGNLALGGTGKTPFIAKLIEEAIRHNKKVGLVSRGYGRRTKGLLKVEVDSKADNVGDEPLLLKMRYPEVHIWVSEKRLWGVKEAEKANVDVIFLDDNFQHRYVKPHFQYMLSRYSNPFFKDYVVPMGRLREFRLGAKRADEIVFTHSPDINQKFTKKCSYYSAAKVTFTQHKMGDLNWVLGHSTEIKKAMAFAGIAHPKMFFNHCKYLSQKVKTQSFPDHHQYDVKDIEFIQSNLDSETVLLTTEKDWVKLKEFKQMLKGFHMATIPVQIETIEVS